MASRESIRAVYADPQVDGTKHFYHTIGAMLKEGVDFDRPYALVVKSASRFTQPPGESEFLAVLEEFCRQEVDARLILWCIFKLKGVF